MPTGTDNGGGDGSSNPSSGDNGYSPSLKDNNMRVTSEAEGMSGYKPKKPSKTMQSNFLDDFSNWLDQVPSDKAWAEGIASAYGYSYDAFNNSTNGELLSQLMALMAIEYLNSRQNVGGHNNPSNNLTNPVPKNVARVIPANLRSKTLGHPSKEDVFVTAAEDIIGLNASQIARKLAIPKSKVGFKVIIFPTPFEGISSPINRLDDGFVGYGRTKGGAREFTIPNQMIPDCSKQYVVK
jgi:hypothetical protein